jgi:hypothetical protein
LKASSIERVVLASDYQGPWQTKTLRSRGWRLTISTQDKASRLKFTGFGISLEQMLLNFRGDLTYHTFDIPNPVNFNRLALSCVEISNASYNETRLHGDLIDLVPMANEDTTQQGMAIDNIQRRKSCTGFRLSSFGIRADAAEFPW